MLHDLTEIYALHCDPRTDVGHIALKVGPITSAVDQVNIVLNGTGGHTSRPQLTQDVIGALGALATMTQLLLSRRIDPRSGVSLMWGSVSSGSVANAIPRTGEIVGTLRALDAAGWLAFYLDDYDRAQALGRESLVLHRELRDAAGTADSLYLLGDIADARGNSAAAADLYQ